ncbi:NAD(P)-binding protein [Abortiporus biennis]|nr:NAD(P)-binding protein [Abortiporus biennis]
MTILITGASGRTSRYVLKAILIVAEASPPDLRLMVHSQHGIDKLKAEFPDLPESSFVIADYMEASTLPPVMKNVDIVFHNGPAFSSLEAAMGIALIDAARDAGVKHFVFCSVLFPLLTKLLNHKIKLEVEEYLVESGLNYTILQPSSYMQNINVKEVVKTGILPCAYNPTTLQGFLDLQDLGGIAALVLLDPTPHNRARYELVGENCSLEEVAGSITRAKGGQIVKIQVVPRDEVIQSAAVPVNPTSYYALEAMERMLYYYDRRGIPGNNNTVRWLLGREPNTWETLLQCDLRLPVTMTVTEEKEIVLNAEYDTEHSS